MCLRSASTKYSLPALTLRNICSCTSQEHFSVKTQYFDHGMTKIYYWFTGVAPIVNFVATEERSKL